MPPEKQLTNRERRFNLLRKNNFFKSFSDEEIATIMERGKFLAFKPFARVVRENTEGNSFFVILNGRANIMKLNQRGKQQMLTAIMDGECFGEMAVLINNQRTASVVTELESQILEIESGQLKTFSTVIRDKIFYEFAVTLARRLKKMSSWKVEDSHL